MQPEAEPTSGVLASAKRLLNTVLATVRNRLELLVVEASEEAQRWLEIFLLAAALTAVGTLALAMISLTIVFACWEEHRLAALVILSACYLLGTLILGWNLRRRLQGSSPFSATIDELKKDKAILEDRTEDKKMNKPQLRKQALILESELNRLMLQAECQSLRIAAERFWQPSKNLNWLLKLAPVAGFMGMRLIRSRLVPVSGWLSVVKWIPTLFSLWRGFTSVSTQKTT